MVLAFVEAPLNHCSYLPPDFNFTKYILCCWHLRLSASAKRWPHMDLNCSFTQLKRNLGFSFESLGQGKFKLGLKVRIPAAQGFFSDKDYLANLCA